MKQEHLYTAAVAYSCSICAAVSALLVFLVYMLCRSVSSDVQGSVK